MPFTIETPRLRLRPFDAADVATVATLHGNTAVMRFLGPPEPSVEKALATIEDVQNQYKKQGIGRLMVDIKDSQTPIGWSFLKRRLSPEADVIDVGHRFLPDYWGQGFAFEAAYASVWMAFNVLKLPLLTACADVDNAASQRILEKLGFSIQAETVLFDRPHHFFELPAAHFTVQTDFIPHYKTLHF